MILADKHNIQYTAYFGLSERQLERVGLACELLSSTPAAVSPSSLPKVVCSWCNSLMREGGLPVSHGLCATCAAQIERAEVSDVERTIEESARLRRVA